MSRRAAAIALGLVVALAACSHPSKVGTPGPRGDGGEGKTEPSRAQKGVPARGERPRVPSSPKALLADGTVAKLQDALAQRGYLAKHAAGELDAATTQALRKFQRDEAIAETGFPDRLTLQKLGLDPEEAYSKTRPESKGGAPDEPKGEGSAGKRGE